MSDPHFICDECSNFLRCGVDPNFSGCEFRRSKEEPWVARSRELDRHIKEASLEVEERLGIGPEGIVDNWKQAREHIIEVLTNSVSSEFLNIIRRMESGESITDLIDDFSGECRKYPPKKRKTRLIRGD